MFARTLQLLSRQTAVLRGCLDNAEKYQDVGPRCLLCVCVYVCLLYGVDTQRQHTTTLWNHKKSPGKMTRPNCGYELIHPWVPVSVWVTGGWSGRTSFAISLFRKTWIWLRKFKFNSQSRENTAIHRDSVKMIKTYNLLQLGTVGQRSIDLLAFPTNDLNCIFVQNQ